jgi:hypothetical protein
LLGYKPKQTAKPKKGPASWICAELIMRITLGFGGKLIRLECRAGHACCVPIQTDERGRDYFEHGDTKCYIRRRNGRIKTRETDGRKAVVIVKYVPTDNSKGAIR